MSVRTFSHSIAALNLYRKPYLEGYYSNGYFFNNSLTATNPGYRKIIDLNQETFYFFKDGTCELSYSHSLELPSNDTYGYFDFQESLFSGLNDFTIEFFVKLEVLDDEVQPYTLFDFYIGNQTGSSKYIKLTLSPFNGSSKLIYPSSGGTLSWVPEGKRVTNEWIHVAVTRQGTTLRTFFNGLKTQEFISFPTGTSGLTRLWIGGSHDPFDGSAKLTGKIHNLRLLVDQCLYTTDFTIPNSDLTSTGYGNTDQSINSGSLKLLSLLNRDTTSVIGPSINMSGTNYQYSYDNFKHKDGYYSDACYKDGIVSPFRYVAKNSIADIMIRNEQPVGGTTNQWLNYITATGYVYTSPPTDGFNRYGYSVGGQVSTLPDGTIPGLYNPNATVSTDISVPLYYNSDGTVQPGFYGYQSTDVNSVPVSITTPNSALLLPSTNLTLAWAFSATRTVYSMSITDGLAVNNVTTSINADGIANVLKTTNQLTNYYDQVISIAARYTSYSTAGLSGPPVTSNSFVVSPPILVKSDTSNIGPTWKISYLLRSSKLYDLSKALSNSIVDLGSGEVALNDIFVVNVAVPYGATIAWSWAPLTPGAFKSLNLNSTVIDFSKYGRGVGYYQLSITRASGTVFSLRFRILSFAKAKEGLIPPNTYSTATIFRNPAACTYAIYGKPCYLNVVWSNFPKTVKWYKMGKKDPVAIMDVTRVGAPTGSYRSFTLEFSSITIDDVGCYYAEFEDHWNRITTRSTVGTIVGMVSGLPLCTGGYFNKYGERSLVPTSYDVKNNPYQIVVNDNTQTYQFSENGTVIQKVVI
jgi:hypothetical protein